MRPLVSVVIPTVARPDLDPPRDRIDGVGIEFVPSRQPLAIWHGEPTPSKLTITSDWRTSVAWARKPTVNNILAR